MFVEVISDDREIKDFCYEPLKSGDIYKATFENKYYIRVFFSIDDEEYDIVVHERHLRTLDLDEIRDFKLNNLGI
jgi:hypothetical protein